MEKKIKSDDVKSSDPAAETVQAGDKPAPAPDKPADPIETVASFLIEGHQNSHILEYLESQQVTPEAAANILEQALKKFIKSVILPKEVRRGWCLEVYRHLYNKMLGSADYAGALRAVQEIAKLAGIQPRKGAEDPPADETDDEIGEYIRRLIEL